MIYTVTFNPAIDYVIHLKDPLVAGATNRTVSEEIYFGGKGINVSVILNELGMETTALGFTAGFTGKAIREGVAASGIHSEFITLPEGNSRINVKIKGNEETEINAQGPAIPMKCVDQLFTRLDEIKEGGTVPGLKVTLLTKGLKREGWELKQKSIRKVVSFKSKKFPKATPEVLVVGYWKD